MADEHRDQAVGDAAGGEEECVGAFAREEVGDRVISLELGAEDYMVKPIELDTLKSKIERTFAALERRKKS